MPVTDDLIARLRWHDTAVADDVFQADHNLYGDAADEIEKLRAKLAEIETAMDSGDFDQWPTHTFVGQLRMQSRDSLDPEYARFMAATATHMGILSGQCDAMKEIADRLRLDLEAKDCLLDSQYIAGVKMGWNLCATEDEAGYTKITGNTEHIAELRRINHLRAQEGSAGGEGV